MLDFWPVARQTFIEAVRARVTAVFIVVLIGTTLLTPLMASSGTLSQQVQTFLVYSVGLSGLVLSMWTLLLGCSLLSGEVETRRIFLPLTKPVSRWHYILGRWAGLAMLQMILVAGLGVAIYTMAQYMRHRPAEPLQKQLLDEQILVARASHTPDPIDQAIERLVEMRWDALGPDRQRSAVEARGGGQDGLAAVLAEIRSQATHVVQTAGHREALRWRFTDLRRPQDEGSMVQFRYRINTGESPPENKLASHWAFMNPETRIGYVFERQDGVGDQATILVPAEAISSDGEMLVEFRNVDPRDPEGGFRASVTILHDEVFVLYPVGGFTANFARGIALMLLLQLFLASLAVLAGSFLSFPVASLVCFVLFVIGLASTFIRESVEIRHNSDAWTYLGHFAASVVLGMLPNFGRGSPTDAFAEGLLISWADLGWAAGLFLIPLAVYLAVAGLIFSRRELARVTA